MEKIININFQGRVIAIEEPAYEVLKKYSDSLQRHFAAEESSDEIIADIENRIAELMAARLKTAACINTADLDQIIESIGRVEDMDAEDTTDRQQTYTGYEQKRAFNASGNDKFYRNADEKVLGGVCSGIAARMNIDTLIVRILFVVFFGAFFWVYVLLWMIVPAHSRTTHITRRLFRDPDSKVIAGVCGGLSHYFNIEAWKLRVLFLFPFIITVLFNSIHFLNFFNHVHNGLFTGYFGSTFFVLYVVLWIAVPYAVSATDKMEMRGEKIDINTIKAATHARTEPAYTNKPAGSGVGRVIGILFKSFFLLIAGSVALSLFAALIGLVFAGAAAMPFTDFVLDGSNQYLLAWTGVILTLSIPFLALAVWIIRRLMNVRSSSHYLGFIFAGLWICGIVCSLVMAGMIVRNFSVKNMVEEEVHLQQPSVGRLYVSVVNTPIRPYHYARYSRWFGGDWEDDDDHPFRLVSSDSLWLNTVKVNIEQSPDSFFHVYETRSGRGNTMLEAKRMAGNINFPIAQADTVISLPKGFTISNRDKFRNQQVLITVEVPLGKTVSLSKDINEYSWFTMNDRGHGVYATRHWDGGNGVYGRDKAYLMTATGLKNMDGTEVKEYEDEDDDE